MSQTGDVLIFAHIAIHVPSLNNDMSLIWFITGLYGGGERGVNGGKD